jgi:BRCT domain type II-containing protein
MTTQLPEDPLTHIKTWQAKFKEHKQQCGVAEMDTPGTTKDSREALHNTSNATDSIKDWRSFWKDVLDEPEAHVYPESELTEAIQKQLTMAKQKTIDNFLDEICCALEEMSGKEVFDCFVKAVESQHEYTKKEYYKTIDLMDLLSVL